MYSLTEGSVDHRYLTLLGSVYWQGEEIQTRNSLCKRLVAFSVHFTSTPLVSIRKTPWRLALREMEWFLSGSNNINDLHPSVRHWWQPFCKVDGHSLCHNYGQALRKIYAPNWSKTVEVEPKTLIDGPVPVPVWAKEEVIEDGSKHSGYRGTNTQGDSFTVLNQVREGLYRIQFDSNGYVVESRSGNFLKGVVKNPYYISVLDAGCIGVVDKSKYSYYRRAYRIWTSMMNRCYNPKRCHWKWYGAKGIKVSPRWRCFEFFLADISRLVGFEEWLLNEGQYSLDKDYHKADYYGPDSCIFIHNDANKTLARSKEWKDKRPELVVDQVAALIEGLKNHPNSRRHVISTWIPEHVDAGLINPTNCHNTVTQAFVEKGKLRLVTYQRSADLLCGLPANWIQEWALLLWLANRTGKEVGGLTWIGGDCHLYKQHWELTDKMVNNAFDCGATPELVYNPTSEEFKADDFSLSGEYKPYYTDKAEMVV